MWSVNVALIRFRYKQTVFIKRTCFISQKKKSILYLNINNFYNEIQWSGFLELIEYHMIMVYSCLKYMYMLEVFFLMIITCIYAHELYESISLNYRCHSLMKERQADKIVGRHRRSNRKSLLRNICDRFLYIFKIL